MRQTTVANRVDPSIATLNRAHDRLRSLASCWISRLWYSSFNSLRQKRLLASLSFISKLYYHLLRYDQRKATRTQHCLPVNVISVGNLVAGGTGKTPFTQWLATYLESLGHRVAILSRGYGRISNTVLRVPMRREVSSKAIEYGDEPILMALKLNQTPVWVGRRRWRAGMRIIEKDQPEIIILDDGFQHLSLHRDLDFVLLDAQNPFGNGYLLPLGPLREPVNHLHRADAIILTRADHTEKVKQTQTIISKRFADKPTFCCRHHLARFRFGLVGTSIPLNNIQNSRLVAFAGIARPDTFFSSLQELGIILAEQLSFPDHHQYQSEDLLLLLLNLSRNDAQFLITTQKDAVRLPPEFRELVVTAELQLDFGSDAKKLMQYIQERLRA